MFVLRKVIPLILCVLLPLVNSLVISNFPEQNSISQGRNITETVISDSVYDLLLFSESDTSTGRINSKTVFFSRGLNIIAFDCSVLKQISVVRSVSFEIDRCRCDIQERFSGAKEFAFIYSDFL